MRLKKTKTKHSSDCKAPDWPSFLSISRALAAQIHVVSAQGSALKSSCEEVMSLCSLHCSSSVLWLILSYTSACLWVFPIERVCQRNFKNTLFPTRLHIGSAFLLTALLHSQSNSICTKDNWTALLCISLHYRKLGGTSVNSEGHGKSASTIWD